MRRLGIVALAGLVAACSHSSGSGASSTGTPTPAPSATTSPAPTPQPPPNLHVRFLGVGGFKFTVGDDAILTAPLFSNPDMLRVQLGSIASEPAKIDQFLGDVSGTRAILSGHAHYDHLLDVPYTWTKTSGVPIYANTSAKHLLAAFAPDACAVNDGLPQIPREAVVALDDITDDAVDWRMCEGMTTCSGTPRTGAGQWIDVPNSHVRIRALCSNHPDTFLGYHFAPGCVENDACTPPTASAEWKEGDTLAYLIDFLDPATGAPRYRVYYQDAPFEAPISYPHPELLAEKSVDLAVVNGGNYEQVDDHPKPILSALSPRYAIVGHWEDFFRTQDQPILAIPFLDKNAIATRMNEVMPPDAEGARTWVPDPQTEWDFKPAP